MQIIYRMIYINRLCFCLKILHMLRLESTKSWMIIYVYVQQYDIEYRANIKIQYNHLCIWFSYPLQTIAKRGPT